MASTNGKTQTVEWVKAKDYEDITYHKADGMARIAFNRPEVRNAFRPKTIIEMLNRDSRISARTRLLGALSGGNYRRGEHDNKRRPSS